MGPMMNLGARVRGDGRRAVPGCAGSGLRAATGRRRRTAKIRRSRRPRAFSSAITSSLSTARQSIPGSSSSSPSCGKAKRELTLGIDRGGQHLELRMVPIARGQVRDRRHRRAARSVHPQIVGAESRFAGGSGRAANRAMSSSRPTARRTSRAIAWSALIKASEGQPIVLDIKRDGSVQQVTVTPRPIGDTLMHRRAAERRRADDDRSRPARGAEDERGAELDVGRR